MRAGFHYFVQASQIFQKDSDSEERGLLGVKWCCVGGEYNKIIKVSQRCGVLMKYLTETGSDRARMTIFPASRGSFPGVREHQEKSLC